MHTQHSLYAPLARYYPLVVVLVLVVTSAIYGCSKSQPVEAETPRAPLTTETSGEDFLVSAVGEIESIANWAITGAPAKLPPKDKKLLLSKTASDSIYVYGQITPDGFGAVVTERHEYPKGFLLITVRKSHGGNSGKMVTETKKFISLQNFQNDIPSQSNLTEVFTQSDTIVTRVLRNGLLETYTFRSPVTTRVVNDVTGAVTVTRRFGSGGAIVSERRDGTGILLQLNRNTGLSDGSLVTRTEYPDTTWRTVRTLGQADRSILREITTGRGQ